MQESNQHCSGLSKSARPFSFAVSGRIGDLDMTNIRKPYDSRPIWFAANTYVASNHRAYLRAYDITRGGLLRSRHRSPSIAQENRAALESVLWQATLA